MLRLRVRKLKRMRTIRIYIDETPPTTPPTMAPVWLLPLPEPLELDPEAPLPVPRAVSAVEVIVARDVCSSPLEVWTMVV